MANVKKKISELTSLTSASLDTVVVGVDNGTTYKIELDVLADGVRDRINTLDYQRLNSLETITASVNNNLSSLNSFTASQTALNTAFTNGINGRLTTSSFNSFSASVHSEILAATNEQSFNGLISGSSQLTSSYDSRYVLSGSITQTTWDNISGKPSGLVSQSTDLTSLNSFTASNGNTSLNAATSSYETKGNGIISGSSQLTSSFDTRYTLSGSVQPLPSNLISSSAQITSFGFVSGSYLTSLSGAISSSSQLTSSYDLRYEGVGRGIVSGSLQLTSSFETTGRGIISSSAQLPNGLISGSSQLTASFDTRYAPSASYLTSLNGAISSSTQLTASFDTRYSLSGSGGSATIPAGTVSGSSQLTSSYDGRYTLTSSFNSFTASAQAVTTGSNSFNGTQTITGSLIITTGSFVGSQILANTSSLYLTSGSNMYVQNNGVVEITGSLNVNGTTTFVTTGGDEGGEINFGIAQTNTTLQNRVTNDIWRDRFRIFEGSANAKGVFIDLSKAPDGASGEITWKASGIVNAGTFVQLDNIKATIPSSGNRALALATVSGTISGYISGHYQGISSSSAGITQTITLSTSTSTSVFGWNFGQQGDTSHYILRDDTNNRVYRFVVIIGGSYNNNFISIERLH